LKDFGKVNSGKIDTAIHKNSTFCFHLEGNISVQREAKAVVDFEKASNKVQKIPNLMDQPQSPTEQSQTTTSKNTRSVYKKNIANNSSFLFFY
jgi:hypothetical protein